MTESLEPALYVVATPIGNMEDLTARAARVLRLADVVACEDTRHSASLLNSVGARGRRIAVHEHNEEAQSSFIVEEVRAGRSVALISDAGTPLISDPGFPVVRRLAAAGLKVVPVPGPSAALAALCISGLSSARFHFIGFLPEREARRDALFEEVRDLGATLIFYAPARDLKVALAQLAGGLGNRQAAICRELTKLHEEVVRGPLRTLAGSDLMLLGEAVIVVAGAGERVASAEELDAAVRAGLSAGEAPSALAKRLARQFNLARSAVYERVVAMRPDR